MASRRSQQWKFRRHLAFSTAVVKLSTRKASIITCRFPACRTTTGEAATRPPSVAGGSLGQASDHGLSADDRPATTRKASDQTRADRSRARRCRVPCDGAEKPGHRPAADGSGRPRVDVHQTRRASRRRTRTGSPAASTRARPRAAAVRDTSSGVCARRYQGRRNHVATSPLAASCAGSPRQCACWKRCSLRIRRNVSIIKPEECK